MLLDAAGKSGSTNAAKWVPCIRYVVASYVTQEDGYHPGKCAMSAIRNITSSRLFSRRGRLDMTTGNPVCTPDVHHAWPSSALWEAKMRQNAANGTFQFRKLREAYRGSTNQIGMVLSDAFLKTGFEFIR